LQPPSAGSNEISQYFRSKPATHSEASQPGIPMEASRVSGPIFGKRDLAQPTLAASSFVVPAFAGTTK
jgi:hypothetical protein